MDDVKPNRPFWRQGDIFFVKLDEEVSLTDGTPLKNGVIARGEQTGHAHRVSPSSLAAGAILVALGRAMYLKAFEAGATIVHDGAHPIADRHVCGRPPARIRRPSLASGVGLNPCA